MSSYKYIKMMIWVYHNSGNVGAMSTNIVVFYKVNVPYSMDDAVIEVYGGDWVFRRDVTAESGERD